MESGTVSSHKSGKVVISGQYQSSLRSSKGMSKKHGSSIKSMHSFTSKSVS